MRSIHDVPDLERPDEFESWFHYALDIVDTRWTDHDRFRIVAKAEMGNAVGGFGLEFQGSEWHRDQVYADVWFDYGSGALFTIGAESDVFAGFLSREVGDGSCGRFVERAEADVVFLNSKPEAMLTERCATKFFLGAADDSEAQVFVNFDIPNGFVEFKEKDPDYRANLLAQLVVH